MTEFHVGTPEAIDIAYDVAGIGTRAVAAIVDVIIWSALMLLIILGAIGLSQFPDPLPTVGAILGVSLSFLLFWGYFVVFEAFWHGQTPGKRLMSIRVLKTSGYPIGFIESAVRNLIRVVDFLPSLYAAGIVTMFINGQARRLGDLAAGTVVVKERKPPKGLHIARLAEPLEPSAPTIPVGAIDPEEVEWNLRSLRADDIQIVTDFRGRASGFPADVRERLGREIADMVAARIGAREPADPFPFLRRVLDLYYAREE